MSKIFVFDVDALESPQKAKLIGLDSFDSYCIPILDPFCTSFTVETSDLLAEQDSFIVLKSAVGYAFSPDSVCYCGSEAIKPSLVTGSYIVIPVNKPLGDYTFTFKAYNFSYDFDVSFVASMDCSDTFGFTSALSFDFVGGVTRKVLLNVEKASDVAKITAGGSEIDFTFVDDTHIVLDLLLSSSGTVTLYDSLDVILATFSVAITLTQTEDASVFVYLLSDLTYIFTDYDYYGIIFLIDGSLNIVSPVTSFDSFYTYSTEEELSVFRYIIRDKGGAVVPNTAYRIYADNFSMTGYADCNGAISVPKASLPDVFTLCFSAYDLGYLSQTFSKSEV